MKKFSRIMLVTMLIIVAMVTLVACVDGSAVASPKYVFMFIGDGMTSPQINAARAYINRNTNQKGEVAIKEQIKFTQFPVFGAATTNDASSLIPDSAASGTSLSGGVKTVNGAIGMGNTGDAPDKTKMTESIATKFKKAGKKVGIVTTANINDATPSAYYAHAEHRSYHYEIATQMAKSNFDYFAGGGIYKSNETISQAELGKGYVDRGNDAYAYMEQNGYTVTDTRAEFDAINSGSGNVYCRSPRLQDESSMYYTVDQQPGDITLTEFVTKGIDVLNNDKGFFMLVEGGKIDWACHANDGVSAIHELLEFDNAVQEAVKFYNQHPKDTVIVVTADHETGGMTMGQSINKYETDFSILEKQKVSYIEFGKYITANIESWNSLDDVMGYIKTNFGMTKMGDQSNGAALEIKDYQYSKLEKAFQVTKHGQPSDMSDQEYLHLYARKGEYIPLATAVTQLLDSMASIGWTTFFHTSADALVFAMGVGAEEFRGLYDNTAIFHKLVKLTKVA